LTVCANACRTALLIAAHGERGAGRNNEATFRIARALSARRLASEVAVGFIRGEPSIKDALGVLTAPRITVYPLFVSNGYFTRDRLAQLLEEANSEGRKVDVMAPLGLDPGLPDLVAAFAAEAARRRGFGPRACNVILLAHGSRKNPASRRSTERMARALGTCASFKSVRGAFLEESPSLDATAAGIQGPIVVVGMFSGEGLHGAKDAPRLVAGLRRDDVAFAGVIGNAGGIEDLVARSVERAFRAVPRGANAPAEWVSAAP
jgi:sirohydrochlorin ferrochelatase